MRSSAASGRIAVLLAAGLLLLAGCAESRSMEGGPPSSLFSDADVADERADCMRDLGWDITVEDGVILAEIPGEQRDRYEEDSLQCLEELGIDPDAGMTDAQFAAAYDWYSEIAECLETAGFDVPDRPSEQAFEDTYDADPWIPWIDLAPEDLSRATELCPMMQPPG